MALTDNKTAGGGLKFDGGKLLAGIILEDFPHAVEDVLKVATFGANKYARSSWQTVPNAKQRYFDAFIRHILADKKGEVFDEESELRHKAHAAWNALALLELEYLEQESKNANTNQKRF